MDALLLILGAALAFAGAMYGQRRESADEHARWLRDRRHDVWVRLLDLMNELLLGDQRRKNITAQDFEVFAQRILTICDQAIGLGPEDYADLVTDARELMTDIAAAGAPSNQLSDEELKAKVGQLARLSEEIRQAGPPAFKHYA